MRIAPLIIALLFISCSGNSDETGEVSTEETISDTSNNTIYELDLNEDRLNAVDYNNRINSIVNSSIDDIDLLFSSDSSDIDQNLENVLFNLDLNHTAVVETAEFEKDEAYRLAVLELLAFYINELNGDFATKIPPLLKKASLTSDEESEIDDYDYRFSKEENEYYQKVYLAQEKFAEANNIKLAEE